MIISITMFSCRSGRSDRRSGGFAAAEFAMILPLVAFLFVVLISAGKTFHLAIGELLRRNDAIMESWLSWESSHSTDGSLRSCIEKIDFKGAFDVPKGICEN